MNPQLETIKYRRKSFGLQDKISILEKQHMSCVCGRKITLGARTLREWKQILGHYPDRSIPSQAKFDHKVPLYKGGFDILRNLQALCGLCHKKKHPEARTYAKR